MQSKVDKIGSVFGVETRVWQSTDFHEFSNRDGSSFGVFEEELDFFSSHDDDIDDSDVFGLRSGVSDLSTGFESMTFADLRGLGESSESELL